MSDPGSGVAHPVFFPAGRPFRRSRCHGEVQWPGSAESMAPVRFDAMTPVQAVRWPQFSFSGFSGGGVSPARPTQRGGRPPRCRGFKRQSTVWPHSIMTIRLRAICNGGRRNGKRPDVEKGTPAHNVPPSSDQPRSEPMGTRTEMTGQDAGSPCPSAWPTSCRPARRRRENRAGWARPGDRSCPRPVEMTRPRNSTYAVTFARCGFRMLSMTIALRSVVVSARELGRRRPRAERRRNRQRRADCAGEPNEPVLRNVDVDAL